MILPSSVDIVSEVCLLRREESSVKIPRSRIFSIKHPRYKETSRRSCTDAICWPVFLWLIFYTWRSLTMLESESHLQLLINMPDSRGAVCFVDSGPFNKVERERERAFNKVSVMWKETRAKSQSTGRASLFHGVLETESLFPDRVSYQYCVPLGYGRYASFPCTPEHIGNPSTTP